MKRLCLAFGAATVASLSLTLAAQPSPGTYPSRPVRVTVPYPAGGSLDLIGRVYAKALGDSLGQPFIVDNRGGANGRAGRKDYTGVSIEMRNIARPLDRKT